MPRKKVIVAIPTVMATRKHRQRSADITIKIQVSHGIGDTIESRSIIHVLATGQHYWEFIMWLYGDSKNMALAC